VSLPEPRYTLENYPIAMTTNLTPAQRTATTAKILMSVGLLLALEAIWRDSMLRAMFSAGVLAGGFGLFTFARRAG
jgi:hypothetical protein